MLDDLCRFQSLLWAVSYQFGLGCMPERLSMNRARNPFDVIISKCSEYASATERPRCTIATNAVHAVIFDPLPRRASFLLPVRPAQPTPFSSTGHVWEGWIACLGRDIYRN